MDEPPPKNKASRSYLFPEEPIKHALASCVGAGGFVRGISRDPLIGRLLHGFRCPGCLLKEAPLLLLGAGGRVRGDAIPCKYDAAEGITEGSLFCTGNLGIHGASDLGYLLAAGIDDITDAAIISVSSHGWLRGIRVVLEGCIEGQLCVEDRFFSGSDHTATFGNKLVIRSGMVDL